MTRPDTALRSSRGEDGVNVHVYPSPFRNESRILRITRSLAECGRFRGIVVIGTLEPNLQEREAIDDCREVERLPGGFAGRRGLAVKTARSALWSLRVLARLRGRDIRCVNAHSLSVLPLCVALKVTHGARLVYDTHELETETVGSRGLRRHISRVVERLLIPFCDAVSVVSEPIGDWYRGKYRLDRVWVVRNVPERAENTPAPTFLLRERLGIPESEFVVLYQGLLAPGRGIQMLIDAFQNVRADRHLVFLGFGPLEERIRQLATSRANVHFHPAVPPAELREFTASADVGLVQTEDTCLSYHLSLPNKLFEYIEAGIPVMSSDLPCTRAVVEEFKCGWVASGSDAIREWANRLDRSSLAAMRRGAVEARGHFDWRNEAKTMFTMYDHVLS